MTPPITTIASIMYSRPPNDVGICAAFSVSYCGKRAPIPSAIPASAKVRSVTVKIEITIMNALTWSSTFVTPTIASARKSSGSVPTQNLAHSSD